MPQCVLEIESSSNGGYATRCAVCHSQFFLTVDPATIEIECSGALLTFPAATEFAGEAPEPPSLPSLASRALHFATALAHHAADGFARRSQEEVEAILETHCKPCPKFDGSHCTVCGCNCNGNVQFINKLAWHSERCPEGKW